MKLRRNIGFTLIEVLLVIGLLGSVTAIAAPNFFGAQDNAEEEACRDQMDFILSGFQTEQLYPDSPYAYVELKGTVEERAGEALLNIYIDVAEDPDLSNEVGFSDPVVCPSGDTQYEAWVDEENDRLYVYCKVHDVLSHASLGPRPLKTDSTVYDTGDGWTSTDNNWIIGDHESFFVLPLEDEYYHAEIGFRFILYDDGVNVEGQAPVDGRPEPDEDPSYEYQYDDPDWFWKIPVKEDVPAGSESYYDVKVVDHATDPDRPAGYDLATYNPTNEELTFSVIIDYQEKGEALAFTSNALEIKNVNSNAQLDMDLDLVKQSEFSPDDTTHADHERDLFDGISDWMIVDVVPYSGTVKKMYIHMLDKNNVFRNIFGGAVEVPVADSEMGDVKFAFFVGKRAIVKDKNLINGLYYPDAYPTPVQVYISDWMTDSDTDYSEFYTNEYAGYTDHLN